jgi:hypothetical protein
MRYYLIIVLLVFLNSCQKQSGNSDLSAIIGSNKAMGFLFVHQKPEVSFTEHAGGDDLERAQGMIASPLLGFIECVGHSDEQALQNYKLMETRSLENQLKVDGGSETTDRRIVYYHTESSSYEYSPCTLIGSHLISYPVLVSMLGRTSFNNPTDSAHQLSFFTKQSILLAFIGSTDSNGEELKTFDLTMSKLMAMATVQEGYDEGRYEEWHSALQQAIPFYNPCMPMPANAPEEPRRLRDSFYEPYKSADGSCDYRPKNNLYEQVKQDLATHVAQQHLTLYQSQRDGGEISKFDEWWDVLTTTHSLHRRQSNLAKAYLGKSSVEGLALGDTDFYNYFDPNVNKSALSLNRPGIFGRIRGRRCQAQSNQYQVYTPIPQRATPIGGTVMHATGNAVSASAPLGSQPMLVVNRLNEVVSGNKQESGYIVGSGQRIERFDKPVAPGAYLEVVGGQTRLKFKPIGKNIVHVAPVTIDPNTGVPQFQYQTDAKYWENYANAQHNEAQKNEANKNNPSKVGSFQDVVDNQIKFNQTQQALKQLSETYKSLGAKTEPNKIREIIAKQSQEAGTQDFVIKQLDEGLKAGNKWATNVMGMTDKISQGVSEKIGKWGSEAKDLAKKVEKSINNNSEVGPIVPDGHYAPLNADTTGIQALDSASIQTPTNAGTVYDPLTPTPIAGKANTRTFWDGLKTGLSSNLTIQGMTQAAKAANSFKRNALSTTKQYANEVGSQTKKLAQDAVSASNDFGDAVGTTYAEMKQIGDDYSKNVQRELRDVGDKAISLNHQVISSSSYIAAQSVTSGARAMNAMSSGMGNAVKVSTQGSSSFTPMILKGVAPAMTPFINYMYPN